LTGAARSLRLEDILKTFDEANQTWGYQPQVILMGPQTLHAYADLARIGRQSLLNVLARGAYHLFFGDITSATLTDREAMGWIYRRTDGDSSELRE
jgi:hypothetical protein